jgi:hypothetical protein
MALKIFVKCWASLLYDAGHHVIHTIPYRRFDAVDVIYDGCFWLCLSLSHPSPQEFFMSSPINAAPYTNWLGIQDDSTAQVTVQPLQVPTHLPLCPLYTPWGPEGATLITPNQMTQLYGADVFNPRSVYYNHQSLYAQTILGQGNQIMVNRIIPEDAGPQARVLLSLDIVAEPALPQYQRNSDGSYVLDASGNKIQITGSGHRCRLHRQVGAQQLALRRECGSLRRGHLAPGLADQLAQCAVHAVPDPGIPGHLRGCAG